MKKLNFIGIGVQRSGTSWLYNALRQHPEVSFGMQKEINFFNETNCFYNEEVMPKNFSKGIKWYLRQLNLKEGKMNGEISPSYFSDEYASYRIKELFPNVKILAILRNPIDRAYSQYRFFCSGSRCHLHGNFDTAVRKYPEFIERGFYYKHLKKYYELFPRGNVGTFIYDDLAENPQKFLSDIEKFLGISEFMPENLFKKVNQPRVYPQAVEKIIFEIRKFQRFPSVDRLFGTEAFIKLRDKFNENLASKRPVFKIDPLKKETIQYLKGVFREDILKLQQLINRDLSIWL